MLTPKQFLVAIQACLVCFLLLESYVYFYPKFELDYHLPRNIFQLETKVGKRNVTAREACSLESVAFHHPQDVITLYNVNGGYDVNDKHLTNLLPNYQNIKIRGLDTGEAFSGTPMESWSNQNAISNSLYPVEHMSDALRIALLWKNGGIYMDTDTIVIKTLGNFTEAVGMAYENISTGFLAFHKHSSFLYRYLKEFVRVFDGQSWSGHGVVLLTSLFRDVCNVTSLFKVINRPSSCGGILVLPHHLFLPIQWRDWKLMWNENESGNQSLDESYALHLYSKMSRKHVAKTGGKTLVETVFKANCPYTYKLMSLDGYL